MKCLFCPSNFHDFATANCISLLYRHNIITTVKWHFDALLLCCPCVTPLDTLANNKRMFQINDFSFHFPSSNGLENGKNVKFNGISRNNNEKLPFSRHWIQNAVICIVPRKKKKKRKITWFLFWIESLSLLCLVLIIQFSHIDGDAMRLLFWSMKNRLFWIMKWSFAWHKCFFHAYFAYFSFLHRFVISIHSVIYRKNLQILWTPVAHICFHFAWIANIASAEEFVRM